MTKVSGQLEKMAHEDGIPINYSLVLDEALTPITPQVGKKVTLKYLGKIACIECETKIKKTYADGYCYPCFRDLPENDPCLLKPELCVHEFGDETDRKYFQKYCKIEHFVYLSLTSGVKVGVTRHFNIPSRWIDQGAVKGLIIARTPQRKFAGQIEVALAKHMADKTNWRKMLNGDIVAADLEEFREKALGWAPPEMKEYLVRNESLQELSYPIKEHPVKVSSHNLEKEPELSGVLTGIKGQYLMFGNKVINLRKYTGYFVEFTFDDA
jgi:hypothetical protein